MTSIEDRLSAMAAAVTPPDLPAAGAVMRRGRQRRRRRRAAGLAAVAALGTGGVGVVLRPDDHDAVVTTSPSGPDLSAPRTEATPGPDLRAVPDVRGLPVSEARSAVESVGLSVAAPAGSDRAEVVAQDPAPGTTLGVGLAVTLTVADLDRPQGAEGPLLRGRLLDGRPWALGAGSHGLCVTLGPSDIGCDDVGPVLPAGADPATPRAAIEPAATEHPMQEAATLTYGYLPPGADAVELVHDDGRTVTDGLLIEPTGRFWGLPVQPGDNPDTVVYRSASGQEVARYPG